MHRILLLSCLGVIACDGTPPSAPAQRPEGIITESIVARHPAPGGMAVSPRPAIAHMANGAPVTASSGRESHVRVEQTGDSVSITIRPRPDILT